jgi:hypothetical protein
MDGINTTHRVTFALLRKNNVFPVKMTLPEKTMDGPAC